MNITIIGVGNVGRALGPRWAELGHTVIYAVRDPESERHAELLARTHNGRAAKVETATAGADVVLIAVPWDAAEAVARGLVLNPFTIVIDATNPLLPAFAGLDPNSTPSGGERMAEWTGAARLIKAFSTTGSANMTNPAYPGAAPAMFLAGDDASAKEVIGQLATAIGFDPVDAGPLFMSRAVEEIALLWIRLAYVHGNGPNIAFALLRRSSPEP